ncbi:MAG: hypothetical protein AAF587_24770 [Bacteroidota bacterium]
MMQKILFSILLLTASFPGFVSGQKASPSLSNGVSLVFGLNQLAINGFNLEANLMWNRLILDYSHGVSLNLSNDMLRGEVHTQGLAVHLPYTTGFGVGYRFNDWLNLRLEPKWHGFELYYDGEAQIPANQIGAYQTFTVGLGAYANLRPFKHQDNFLKGLMIVPNLRWWPRVSSSLEGNQLRYTNRISKQEEIHEAMEIGMGNTPFFVNASIGYSLTF